MWVAHFCTKQWAVENVTSFILPVHHLLVRVYMNRARPFSHLKSCCREAKYIGLVAFFVNVFHLSFVVFLCSFPFPSPFLPLPLFPPVSVIFSSPLSFSFCLFYLTPTFCFSDDCFRFVQRRYVHHVTVTEVLVDQLMMGNDQLIKFQKQHFSRSQPATEGWSSLQWQAEIWFLFDTLTTPARRLPPHMLQV